MFWCREQMSGVIRNPKDCPCRRLSCGNHVLTSVLLFLQATELANADTKRFDRFHAKGWHQIRHECCQNVGQMLAIVFGMEVLISSRFPRVGGRYFLPPWRKCVFSIGLNSPVAEDSQSIQSAVDCRSCWGKKRRHVQNSRLCLRA